MKISNKHDYYVLYLEYLGGLIPLLIARKSSNLKPDFVIFDPFLGVKKQKKSTLKSATPDVSKSLCNSSGYISSGDYMFSNKSTSPFANLDKPAENVSVHMLDDVESSDVNLSLVKNKLLSADPANNSKLYNEFSKSKKKKRNKKRSSKKVSRKKMKFLFSKSKASRKESATTSDMINKKYLASITSNIWGTKFKFSGQNYLPQPIGNF